MTEKRCPIHGCFTGVGCYPCELAKANLLRAELAEAKAEIERLKTRYDALLARIRHAELRQCGWEGNADIVLLNGVPVGGTITRNGREFDRWWPAVKAALLKPEGEEVKSEPVPNV